jgi:hypothetical protein
MEALRIRHERHIRSGRVKYLEGSAFNAVDIQRARVDTAVAVFVLAARVGRRALCTFILYFPCLTPKLVR